MAEESTPIVIAGADSAFRMKNPDLPDGSFARSHRPKVSHPSPRTLKRGKQPKAMQAGEDFKAGMQAAASMPIVIRAWHSDLLSLLEKFKSPTKGVREHLASVLASFSNIIAPMVRQLSVAELRINTLKPSENEQVVHRTQAVLQTILNEVNPRSRVGRTDHDNVFKFAQEFQLALRHTMIEELVKSCKLLDREELIARSPFYEETESEQARLGTSSESD